MWSLKLVLFCYYTIHIHRLRFKAGPLFTIFTISSNFQLNLFPAFIGHHFSKTLISIFQLRACKTYRYYYRSSTSLNLKFSHYYFSLLRFYVVDTRERERFNDVYQWAIFIGHLQTTVVSSTLAVCINFRHRFNVARTDLTYWAPYTRFTGIGPLIDRDQRRDRILNPPVVSVFRNKIRRLNLDVDLHYFSVICPARSGKYHYSWILNKIKKKGKIYLAGKKFIRNSISKVALSPHVLRLLIPGELAVSVSLHPLKETTGLHLRRCRRIRLGRVPVS